MLSGILIIGAGASGLMAARHLAAAGCSVTVLEAADFPGGRVHTQSVPGFSGFIEAGAEFVHGDLPVSLKLAGEAGVALLPTHPNRRHVRQEEQPDAGHHEQQWEESRMAHWQELLEKMSAMVEDEPITSFLATQFPGEEYAGLRKSVKQFAQGYDLADLRTVSTRALYKEWSSEEDSGEYRVVGGYHRLIDYLVAECQRHGCILHFSSPVTGIRWQESKVEVTTVSGQVFSGQRLIITVSLGVLPRLSFTPAIPDYLQAAARIGFGSVIKILLEFRTPFWRGKNTTDETLFVLSDQPVPTWWTQTPADSVLLTAWLTGDAMYSFQALDREAQLGRCLDSLAPIFSVDREFLHRELTASLVVDWQERPYIHGGYSFDTVATPWCRALLRTPIAQTLFFAGEAMYEGSAPGTVEAAFHSGLEVAENIIAQEKG